VLQHGRLILLDRDHVVTAAVDHLVTEIPLTKHGVPGDDLAAQRQDTQKLQGRLVLVGRGVDAELGDHRADARCVGGQQVNARHLITRAATQGLAIQSDGVTQIGAALLEPRGQDLFVRAGVEPAKHIGERRFTRRRPVGEAEDFGQFPPMIAGELGDGFQGLHARQQSDRRQVENGQQRVPSTLSLADVGKACQGFLKGHQPGSHRVHALHRGLRLGRDSQTNPNSQDQSRGELNRPGMRARAV
jgi:hypothetical protein